MRDPEEVNPTAGETVDCFEKGVKEEEEEFAKDVFESIEEEDVKVDGVYVPGKRVICSVDEVLKGEVTIIPARNFKGNQNSQKYSLLERGGLTS